MACPDENVLAQLAGGLVAAAQRPALEAHLDGCSDCRALVAAVAGGSNPPVPLMLEPIVSEGDVLGRYRIERQLGAGGMGVLYSAHDVRLDRRVALKLIHPGLEETSGKARLRREAQAMARLNHPNVAGVYDLGEHKGRFFLAMELVEGGTLRDWMNQSHSTREILAAFAAAGEGLAAAHKAGVVHRDFKPENVLIGKEGRVRVTDFGLSRPLADRWGKPASPVTALTQVGALVGTLAYMSPEQLAANPADARSDQYAFCVALHEALFGMRPHPDAKTPDELRAAQLAVSPERPAGKDDVPAHVWEAIARGLSFEPARRFRSMGALLRALQRKPPLSKWWTLVPLGAALTSAAAVIGYGAVMAAVRSDRFVPPTPVVVTVSSNPVTRVSVLKPSGERLDLGPVPIDRARGAMVGDTVVLRNDELGILYEEKIQFGQPNENWVRVKDFATGRLTLKVTGGDSRNLTVWRGQQLVSSNVGLTLYLFEGIQKLELRGDALLRPVPFEVRIEPNMANTAIVDIGSAFRP